MCTFSKCTSEWIEYPRAELRLIDLSCLSLFYPQVLQSQIFELFITECWIYLTKSLSLNHDRRKCSGNSLFGIEYVWITKAFYSLLILHLLVHDCDLILNIFLLILFIFIYFNHMSLEICSFVVWSVWADQYWHLRFSWTWWQGGELEHQWRLNESAESEKLLRGCGCGPTGGGWFIHGVAGSSSVRVVALCAAEREMRPLCIILQHCGIQRRREDWADMSSHKSFYISPHIKMYLYCLSSAICHIPLHPLQYFLFLLPTTLFLHCVFSYHSVT